MKLSHLFEKFLREMTGKFETRDYEIMNSNKRKTSRVFANIFSTNENIFANIEKILLKIKIKFR